MNEKIENLIFEISQNKYKLIVIVGKKNENNPKTPAKNLGIEAGDLIIKVENKKNPSKKEFDIELKNSKGKEIRIQIKNQNNNIVNKKIKPFNKNEGTKSKKRWDIGATYFEREIDPFIQSLIKGYNIDLNVKDKKKTNLIIFQFIRNFICFNKRI